MSAITLDMEAGLGVVIFVNRVGRTSWAQAVAQHALTVVRAGHCHEVLPPLPPATDPSSIPDATDYAGTYHAGNRVLQLSAEGGKLLLTYKGQGVALERRAQDHFYVGHPELDLFLLEFQRDGGKVVEALHGSHWYINDRYSGPRHFDYPAAWEAYAGHYRAHNPEQPNFRVVVRKGALALIFPGWATEALEPLEDGISASARINTRLKLCASTPCWGAARCGPLIPAARTTAPSRAEGRIQKGQLLSHRQAALPAGPPFSTPYIPCRMKSATRSPIIMVVTLVLARMQSGMIEASTTRRLRHAMDTAELIHHRHRV